MQGKSYPVQIKETLGYSNLFIIGVHPATQDLPRISARAYGNIHVQGQTDTDILHYVSNPAFYCLFFSEKFRTLYVIPITEKIQDTYLHLVEPPRQKTYLRTCMSSENSNQPVHSFNFIRIITGRIWLAKDAKFLNADNQDSNQTARMRRLI